MNAHIEISQIEIRSLFIDAINKEVTMALKLLNFKQLVTEIVTKQVSKQYATGLTDGRFIASVAKNLKMNITIEDIAPYITEDAVSKVISKIVSDKLSK